MAKMINLNFKRNVNVFTNGNPSRAWPHVLQTKGLSKNTLATLDFNFALNPTIPAYLTATRSATAPVIDFEGLSRTAKINEVRFQNARRVENILAFSEDFSNAAWTKGASSGTRTGTVTPPTGVSLASSWNTSGASANSLPCYSVNYAGVDLYNRSFIGTVWLKSIGGVGKTVNLRIARNVGTTYVIDAPITLTATWTRYYVGIWTYPNPGVSTGVYFGVTMPATNIPSDFQIAGAMLKEVTGQANKNPSEYVSTNVLSYPYHGSGADGVKYFTTNNGNTVSSNVVIDAVGTPLTGPITLLAGTTDALSFTGAGLSSWYNTQQGTFIVKASGTAFRSPSAFGAFNLTLPTAETYAVVYNNITRPGNVYLYTSSGGSTPVEYTGVTNPLTTVSLLNGGSMNLSTFTYYPAALITSTVLSLMGL